MSVRGDTPGGHDLAGRGPGEERLRFLAEASDILFDSLDHEAALEKLARLSVPALGDWCVVDLLGDDGLLYRLAVVHRDPARADAAAELKRRYGVLSPERPHTVWKVLPSGPPVLDPEVSETRFVIQARDAEHLALLQELGYAAEMVLPLIARGRPLGVMTLVLGEGGRRYEPEDLALAEELARRAAVAIDNARLFADAQAAEARYRSIFEGVADAILVTDSEGRVSDANDAAAALLGCDCEALRGSALSSYLPGADQDEATSAQSSGQDRWVERVLRRCNGTEVPVEARWTTVELPTGPVALTVVRDITEQRTAEMDRQRMAALVESSDDAIIGKTLEAIVTSWNPAAERMYGYTADEIVGQSIARIFPPENLDELAGIMERLRRGGRIHHHDTVRVTKSGHRLDVSVSISPITDAAGRLTGAATIARDISERKRLEMAQRDVLAMVSHDLRSPLTVIRGNAQLLQRRGEYREASVAAILVHADRMARLTEDLTEIVRLEEGRFPLRREAVDLVVLAEAAVAAAQAQSDRHEIRVEGPAGSVTGFWDRVRLGQVVENLLGNAVKHAVEGGEVIVTVTAVDGEARLSVRDNGPGIAPEHLDRLFERFYQADPARGSGLGLGLYISRILVEAHGGRIWAESELGRGSAFFIALPLAAPAAG